MDLNKVRKLHCHIGQGSLCHQCTMLPPTATSPANSADPPTDSQPFCSMEMTAFPDNSTAPTPHKPQT